MCLGNKKITNSKIRGGEGVLQYYILENELRYLISELISQFMVTFYPSPKSFLQICQKRY